MLKHIDPVLSPDLLKALMEMGHEDSIVLADANFTAAKFEACTISKQIIRLPGLGLSRVARAILSVLPLGVAAEQPVRYMQFTERAIGWMSTVQKEVIDLVQTDPACADIVPLAVERFAFYEQARSAHLIVQTGELAPFANFIFKKGVLAHSA